MRGEFVTIRAWWPPILFGALALTACGSAGEPGPGEIAVPSEPSILTVASDYGDVEVPAEPTRALGMYTTDVDILATLGFDLADSQPIRGDGGYTAFPDFFPDELEGIDVFANYPEYNYEAIALARPDFILNGLGYDKTVVKRLPEIAPTYSVDAFDGQNWMVHFEETARALGREEEFLAWQEAYDARVAEVKEAIGAEEFVVAPISYYDGRVTSACYTGVECQAFEDLGLTVYDGAQRKGGAGVELSLEELDRLEDIDYAFAIASPDETDPFADLADSPLWQGLPFVSEDGIVTYELEMTFGSPSGQMAFLDVVEEALAP